MNEFIVLHDCTENNKELIFNLTHIVRFCGMECWTNVCMTDQIVLPVKESLYEILEIIRGGQNAN